MSGARSRASVGVIALRSRLVSVAGPSLIPTLSLFTPDARRVNRLSQGLRRARSCVVFTSGESAAGGGHNQDDGKVMFVR